MALRNGSGYTILLWCCLLLLEPKGVLTQDETQTPRLNCSQFQIDDAMGNTKDVVVNTSALNSVANDLQFLFECVPPNQSIIFDVPFIRANRTIVIDKPVSLEASESVGRAAFGCPPGTGIFDIQSHGVTMLNLVFSNCAGVGEPVVKVSECGTEPNPVSMIGVEFVSIANSNGSAGVEVSGCNVRMRDSVFRNCFGRHGAALDIQEGSSVVIENATFLNNTASMNGAAVRLLSSAAVINVSNFSSNSARMQGGAVFTEGNANLTINGCMFNSNIAGFQGGALFAESDSLSNITIAKSEFVLNTADGSAVNVTEAISKWSNYSFSFPVPSGGAVELRGTGIQCNIRDGSSFFRNSVAGSGGAIDASTISLLTIDSSSFRGNQAWSGGSIFARISTVRIAKTNFTENSVRVSQKIGGAIASFSNTLELDTCSFINNFASQGGAIMGFTGDKTVARGCTLTGNNATQGGAVSLFDKAQLDMADCTCSDNIAHGASFGLAGVVQLFDGSQATVRSSSFRNNSANLGGVFYLDSFGSIELESSVFTQNNAGFAGGAVFARGADVKVTNCSFDGNTAALFGGAIQMRTPADANVSEVLYVSETNFTRNSVWRSELSVAAGGAVFCGDFTRLEIAIEEQLEEELIVDAVEQLAVAKGKLDCAFSFVRFVGNTARQGGAISSVSTPSLSLDFVDFFENSADQDGGALFLRMGGGVEPQQLEDPDTYVSGGNLSFSNNVAMRGGAAFSGVDTYSATASLLRSSVSVNDVSRTNKDGQNGNEDDVFFQDCIFTGNSAKFSGGAWYSQRTRVGCRNCTYSGNAAEQVAGGALHMTGQSVYHGRNVTLQGNEATTGAAIYASNSVIDLVVAQARQNAARGDGGAVYISTLTSTSFRFGLVSLLENMTIENNSASVGAGIYFLRKTDSQPGSPSALQYLAVAGTIIAGNNAHRAGPALFTNSPEKVDVCCSCVLNKTFFGPPVGDSNYFNPNLRVGVDDIVRVSRSGIAENPYPCPETWINNTVSVEGESGAVATQANSTRICIGNTTCSDEGRTLRILNHTSGTDLENVTIELLDIFGFRAFGQESQVSISSQDPRVLLSGQLLENFNTGTHLSSIRLVARINNTYNLSLAFHPIKLNPEVIQVAVRGCLPGEELDDNGEGCTACGEGLYNFNPADGCLECPDDASCQGHTATPRNGFWHSTSKSIQMHECILPSKCAFVGRATTLRAQAFQAHLNGSILPFQDNEIYTQCVNGHHGVLCGACDEDFGKVRSGECIDCGSHAKDIAISILLALWLLFLIVLLMKNVLTVHRGESTSNVKNAANQQCGTLEEALEGGPQGSHSHVVQAMSFFVAGKSPPEERKQATAQANARDMERLIARGRIFSSEILKILVNFAQVTGIAVFVNAGWTLAVSRVLGGVDFFSSSGQGLFSLECVFDFNSSIPRSVRSAMASVLLPVVLQVLLFIAFALYAVFSNMSFSRLVRRWILVFLAVYYITYTDMTRNVMRILDCTDVDLGQNQPEMSAIATSKYWVQDTDVICRKDDHLILTWALAVPVMLLVIAGFPVGLLAFFLWHRGDLNKRESMETYGFLYWAYRPTYRYWEFMILLRKASMAAVAVFSINIGANMQAALAGVVLVAAVVAHQWARPYVTGGPDLHRMETLSLSCSILAFLSGLIFNDPKTSDKGRIAVSVVVIMAVVVVFSYLVYEYIRASLSRLDTFLEVHGVKVDPKMTLATKIGETLGVIRRVLQDWWNDNHRQKHQLSS